MASKILMALSAGIVFVLGVLHLIYTFSGSGLLPHDPGLQATLSQAHLSITKETTVLRAWTGFNASHGIGLLFFGLIFSFLALSHNELLFGSVYLLAVGFAVLVGFCVLSKLYWFSIPSVGLLISLACYVASIVAARTYQQL